MSMMLGNIAGIQFIINILFEFDCCGCCRVHDANTSSIYDELADFAGEVDDGVDVTGKSSNHK